MQYKWKFFRTETEKDTNRIDKRVTKQKNQRENKYIECNAYCKSR